MVRVMVMVMVMVTSGGFRISSSKPGGVALSTSIRAAADLQNIAFLIQIQIHTYSYKFKYKYKYTDKNSNSVTKIHFDQRTCTSTPTRVGWRWSSPLHHPLAESSVIFWKPSFIRTVLSLSFFWNKPILLHIILGSISDKDLFLKNDTKSSESATVLPPC